MKKRIDIQKSIIYIAFVVLFLVFSITLRDVGSGFASVSNIMNILRQTCLVAIMAVGMTFVLGAALIDLSTGPVVACTSLICGIFLQEYGLWAGVFAGLLFGVLAGMLNGFLVAYLKCLHLLQHWGHKLFLQDLQGQSRIFSQYLLQIKRLLMYSEEAILARCLLY